MTTHRPTLHNSLDRVEAHELTELADSIAARSDELVERRLPGPRKLELTRQAGHAEGVRDVLRWLTGQPPSAMLCDTLDLDPKE